MKKIIFGLFKSPVDIRDYVVASFLKDITLPAEQDYTSKMTPVRNQGNEGACVGFAMVAGVKEYEEQLDYSKFVNLSPRFLYENAKTISGHKEGTTLKAAVEVAQKLGVCEEALWPYTAQVPGSPDKMAYPNALKYRISVYARITDLNELKRAICASNIGPCMIGVEVFKGMVSEDAKKTGVVPNPSCFDRMNVLGGHALCAVGYNDKSPYYKNDGHVKCKNSWGKDWGDKGYMYLSYKYINSHMIDAFSCVDIQDDKPYRILTIKDTGRRPWA